LEIFSRVAGTKLSSLKNRFYTAIPVIRQDIKAALKNKGMYLLDPDSANAYSVGAAIVIVTPFLIAQFTGYKQVFNSVLLLIGCGIVSAIIWWLFAREMSAKTLQGGRTRVAVLGLQEFMNRVDADRLKRMPPDTFENICPRHGWAWNITGRRPFLESSEPAELVRLAQRDDGLQSSLLLQFDAQTWRRHAPGICFRTRAPVRAGSGFGGGGGGGFSGAASAAVAAAPSELVSFATFAVTSF